MVEVYRSKQRKERGGRRQNGGWWKGTSYTRSYGQFLVLLNYTSNTTTIIFITLKVNKSQSN